MSKQKLLSTSQRAIETSGLTRAEIARKLGIPPQRISEFMKADHLHGLQRVEQVLELLRPDLIDALDK